MEQYLDELLNLFVSMSFYMVIGLLCTGFLHAFVKEHWIKKQLGSKSASSIVKASVVGVPLPLCSCGVVPMAVYLRQSGASKGAVMSFLTSTPQTGVDSLIATYGLMGPLFAVFRALAAFVSGIITGVVTDLLGREKKRCCCSGHKPEPQPEAKSCCCSAPKPAPQTEAKSCCCSAPKPAPQLEAKSCCCSAPKPNAEPVVHELSFCAKVKSMFSFAFGEFLDKIATNFLVGLMIAALIATIIPDEWLSMVQNPLISMLIVLVVGIPMYVCSTASIPIAVSLIMKGLSPGTAFVFLFAGPATNIASIAVLLKAFDKKTIIIYILTLSACAVGFGLLLDYFGGNAVVSELHEIHCHEHSLFMQIVAACFALNIAYRLIRGWRKKSA